LFINPNFARVRGLTVDACRKLVEHATPAQSQWGPEGPPAGMQGTQFQQLPQTQMAAAAVVMGQIVLRVGTWDTASIQIIDNKTAHLRGKIGFGHPLAFLGQGGLASSFRARSLTCVL
jgi:hypothetical protein